MMTLLALLLAWVAWLPIMPVVSINDASRIWDCNGDTYNCNDFADGVEAQAAFDYCVAAGLGDVHRLDADNDNDACERN